MNTDTFWAAVANGDHRPKPSTLRRYLSSPRWWLIRDRYFESPLPKRCLICDARRVQLHHTDYRNLGREPIASLRPLCAAHHKGVHQTLNRYRIFLKDSDEAIRIVARNFEVFDIDEKLKPFGSGM